MCLLCVRSDFCSSRRLPSNTFIVLLAGDNLKRWRKNTLRRVRQMMGEDFRVEQLRYVNKDDYQRLYKQVFWDRVHPIYRMYMKSKPEWDLQELWFKLGDLHRNQPLLVFYWTKLLQTEIQSAGCLISDILYFRFLINENDSSGLLTTLCTAVPEEMDNWTMKKIALGTMTVSGLLKRLDRLNDDFDIDIIKMQKKYPKCDGCLSVTRQSYWKW